MRRTTGIACLSLLGGVALISAGAATAAGNTVRTYAGITCSWPSSSSEGTVVCHRANGTGLAVGVAIRFVFVRTWRTGKVLFFRNQPTNSPGYGPLRDKRIFHSETHRGIVCQWSRTAGGTALCNRADRHGYLAAVSHFQVLVGNDRGRIVYVRNQP
jgi:hypothetical protein